MMIKHTLAENEFTDLQLDISDLELKLSKKIIEVKPLTGGLTNQCWKISTECGRHFVWRPCSLATQNFALNRWHEHQILSALNQAEFAPNVEAVLSDGLLVEWVDGITLNEIETNSLPHVMSCLAQLHLYPLSSQTTVQDLKIFDYQSCILGYWDKLPELERDLIGLDRFNWFYEQAHLLHSQTELVTGVCLCHFDLGDYNIIQKPHGELVVIDWEYAAIASPIIDFTTSVLAGQFDLDESLACYASNCSKEHHQIDMKQWKALVLQWVPLLRFMAVLWHKLSFHLYGRESDKLAIEFLEKQLLEV